MDHRYTLLFLNGFLYMTISCVILIVLRNCFGPDSEFLRQLLYFFDAQNVADFSVLVETCRLLQRFVQDGGNFIQYFSLEK